MRKAKGPPMPNPLADLPPLPSGLETSSDDLEKSKGEAKRLRSTSTTTRCEPLRARDPFEYDQMMGINSVGPSSEKGDEPELTDGTINKINL